METILSYLKNRFGYDNIDRNFYRKIDEWDRWYSGNGTDFHRTRVNNGLSVIEHDLSQMNMAKKIAEDWANLLMNEKTRIDTDDDGASEFLRGKNGKGGVLGENDFWTGINQLVERSFALGTGAVVLRLENARVDGNDTLLPSLDGKIRLEYVTAQNIIPLSWQGQTVTEAAFAGSMTVAGQSLTYLQIHRKEGDGYVIDSVCFSDKTGKKVPLPEGICATLRTKSKTPWFVLIKPNIVNNLTNLPMGISVYANSIDILKGLDLCYDSFHMEFYLGKKMVFLRKDLMMQDQEGRIYAPQDCNRQLFMYIGDKNVDGDLLPQEFNPALRVEDHTQAIQQHLNYLSCKCGFGDRYYRFNGDFTPSTATEVISADAALYRSVRKHEILLEQPLVRLMETILKIGKEILGISIRDSASVSVRFDDSIIEDRTAEQKRDMELVSMGLMLDWEFRMKYYGEGEETARNRCKEGSR
ncbi:MAG: phage portal protein [Clostridia bacterium]|nr:phage portal protein [Clostridia bacterium]